MRFPGCDVTIHYKPNYTCHAYFTLRATGLLSSILLTLHKFKVWMTINCECMGVVSRRQVWLVGVGGIYGCGWLAGGGCGWNLWVWLKGGTVYRFPHITYPYSTCICSFLQQHPYFLSISKMFSFLFQYFFVIYVIIFSRSINTHTGDYRRLTEAV